MKQLWALQNQLTCEYATLSTAEPTNLWKCYFAMLFVNMLIFIVDPQLRIADGSGFVEKRILK